MKSKTWKSSLIRVLALGLSVALCSCGGSSKLSKDFDEAAVKSQSEEVILLLNDKKTDEIHAQSTEVLKVVLAEESISKVYSMISEGGKFEKIEDIKVTGTTDKDSGEEFAVAVVKAKYALRSFTYTISFTKQMKLAGLYLK